MKASSSAWQINAFGAAALVALTAVLGVAPLWMLWQNRQSVAGQAEALEVARRDHAAAMSTLAATRSRLVKVQDDLAANAIQLEPASAVNRRLADLSELATRCGLEVDELKPAEPLSGRHSQRVPVHMIARGSYRECVVFLNRLRRQLPDTGAGSMELSGAPTESDWRISLRCVLWWHATPDDPTELTRSHPRAGRGPQT